MTVAQPDFLFTMDQSSGATIVNYGTQGTSYVIDTAGATENTDWDWEPDTGPLLGRYEGITDGGANMPWWSTAATTPGNTVETINVMVGFYLRSLGDGGAGATYFVGDPSSGNGGVYLRAVAPAGSGDFDLTAKFSNTGGVQSDITVAGLLFSNYYMACASLDTSVADPYAITLRVGAGTPATNTLSFVGGHNLSDSWPVVLRDIGFTIYFGLDGFLTAFAYQKGGTAWTAADMAAINADPGFIDGWPVQLSITSIAPTQIHDDQTGVVITGTNFGSTQGTVKIGGRAQTITAWSDTSITFTAERGTDNLGTTPIVVTKPL